jgi:hypothetical protein
MATQKITTGEGSGAVPVACTLTSAGLAAQGDRWEQLAARAMTGRAETAQGLRVFFRAEPGVEDELRALAAVENQCCAWAGWTVRADTGQVVLDVRSAADGIAALHSMFTSLPTAPAARGG